MNESFRLELYKKVILPEFGYKDATLKPVISYDFDSDDAALVLYIDDKLHVLYWEDFGGLAKWATSNQLGLSKDQFEFVLPQSEKYSPSVRFGFKGTPHNMTWYVTGCFTLVKLKISEEELKKNIPIRYRLAKHKESGTDEPFSIYTVND